MARSSRSRSTRRVGPQGAHIDAAAVSITGEVRLLKPKTTKYAAVPPARSRYHGLGAGAVAGVPAPADGHVVFFVAEVFIHFRFKSGLHDVFVSRFNSPSGPTNSIHYSLAWARNCCANTSRMIGPPPPGTARRVRPTRIHPYSDTLPATTERITSAACHIPTCNAAV